MPKIGLDHGSFGLVSGAPMGGEYLGTIGTIPGGLQRKWSLPDWKTPFVAQKWPKNAQSWDFRGDQWADNPQSNPTSEKMSKNPIKIH